MVIIFIIALSTFFFFPDFDLGSFAPSPRSVEDAAKGVGGLVHDQVEWKGGKKEPNPVDNVNQLETDPDEEEGTTEILHAEDPLIQSIERLRTSLKENYVVE